MRLPNFKRLVKTDYDEKFQDLVEQLGLSINTASENIITAFNNNISLKDNILCTVKDFEVQVTSAGIPKETVQVALDFSGSATQVVVGRVENLTNPNVYPTSGVTVSFVQTGSRININHITGLPAGYKFKIRVTIYS